MLLNTKQLHRLSTKEDGHFFHLHKILGFACLAHFMYRIVEGFRYGTNSFSPSTTPIWIGLHAALHITAFQFILPQKRNHVYNTIWPEMRLHTMIFAYRSLVTMLLIYFNPYMLDYFKGLIVLSTIILADTVTWYYKDKTGLVNKEDSTMRKNPYPSWVSPRYAKWHNYMYSLSQVLGTMNILTYNDMGRIFMILIPIQTAPFCMTLVKKGIINQLGWHVYYTSALLINFIYGILENGHRLIPAHAYWSLAIGFCILRFHFNVDKYVLWSWIICVQLYYTSLNTPLIISSTTLSE